MSNSYLNFYALAETISDTSNNIFLHFTKNTNFRFECQINSLWSAYYDSYTVKLDISFHVHYSIKVLLLTLLWSFACELFLGTISRPTTTMFPVHLHRQMNLNRKSNQRLFFSMGRKRSVNWGGRGAVEGSIHIIVFKCRKNNRFQTKY